MGLTTVLLLLAFICFLAATFNLSVFGLNLVALGLALWVATLILGVLTGIPTTVLIVILLIILIVLILVFIQRGGLHAPPK